jgi:(aminoalkyl)phosphonate N-acetyltransferase
MEIIIRNAEPKDLDTIFNFICELENEVFDYQLFKGIFEENLQNSNYVYYVAEIENQVVGFISFHTQKLLHHCGIVGEIQEFYVSQNFRNQQIGRFLVNKVKDYAKTHKLKSIEVTSNKLRTDNVYIYEHLGFRLSHNKFTINTTLDS